MIVMRHVRAEDKEKIRNWRNKPSVAQYMYTDNYITREEHERWFARVTSDPTLEYWIITYDGEDIGLLNLYGIDECHRRCYWAFYVAEEGLRRKGVGGSVEYFVLKYVFEELKLNKLCCEVLASNQAVVGMHKSFGFREEGYFRQHVMKGGKSADIHCLAMLREEWEQLRASIEERLRGKGLL